MNNKIKVLISCIFFVLIICIVICIINNYIIINGQSMYPTLKHNQICRIHRNAEINIGSIVVFKYKNALVVKRVCGMEGDYVEICKDGIYINSNKLYDLNNEEVEISFIVGEDELFVLGDNLQESVDSRVFGCINISQVVGVIY